MSGERRPPMDETRSKVFTAKGEGNFGYRYDYASERLEFVSKFDCYAGKDGKPSYLLFIDWVVMRTVGLPLSDWEADPGYWIERCSGLNGIASA